MSENRSKPDHWTSLYHRAPHLFEDCWKETKRTLVSKFSLSQGWPAEVSGPCHNRAPFRAQLEKKRDKLEIRLTCSECDKLVVSFALADSVADSLLRSLEE